MNAYPLYNYTKRKEVSCSFDCSKSSTTNNITANTSFSDHNTISGKGIGLISTDKYN